MAPKNLVSSKRREQGEEKIQNRPKEERTDSDPDSDSEAAEEVPKKTKFTKPQKLAGHETVENGSACSSPSASGFLIVPSQKPSGEKEKKMKKAHVSKVFTDDDVIAMLNGLADFWANGRNNKWAEFHLFIKDVLRNQFTKTQVSEKIRSLKKKFDSNLERARANGGHLDLSDPHDADVFELSKALWSSDEKGIAPEKAQIAENEDEKENEIRRERKKVSDNGDGSKSMKKRKKVNEDDGSKSLKKQKQVDESDEESKSAKRRKQVDENTEVSKKEKNRKQLGEHGEENKKMSKLDHGIEELLGGDERDAANTILSIRKLVKGHGEGNKKKKKRKHVDEHDENREIVEQGILVNGHDEANKTPSKRKRIDEHGKGNKKKRKQKQVDELDEANKRGEQKEVDELIEANKTGEQKRAAELDEANKAGEQKEVDEHDEKKEIVKKAHQVDLHVEKEELFEEGEQVNEHEEQDMTTRNKKQVDGHGVDKGLVKKRKHAHDHHEENNMPANRKQKMRIRAEGFQSAYPLLYASFHTYRYPRFGRENCALIGQENAQELEEKWRDLYAEMHRFELKRLELMKRDSHRLPGK